MGMKKKKKWNKISRGLNSYIPDGSSRTPWTKEGRIIDGVVDG